MKHNPLIDELADNNNLDHAWDELTVCREEVLDVMRKAFKQGLKVGAFCDTICNKRLSLKKLKENNK